MKKGKLIVLIILALIILGGFIAIKPIKKSLAVKKNETGIVLYEKEKYNEALPYFEKAVKLNDSFKEAYINLAKNLLALNENKKAFKIAKKGLELGSSAELYTICGQVKVKEEAYSESLEYLNKAIEIDTNLAVAYYYRGIAKANKGDLEASLKDYKKAQELNADNPEFFKGSVIIRTKLDDYGGIIKDYNKIIELDPTNTEAFYQRGYFKLNLDDYKGAIEDFDNAIELDPELGKAYYYKGLTNTKIGNLKEAAETFNKSAEFGYKKHEAYFNAGLALLQQNSLEKAKSAFEKSIKSNANGNKSVEAKINLGIIELMKNKYDNAISIFNDILKIDRSNTSALYNRAYAYGNLKKYQKAIDDLTGCIANNYTSPDVYYLRAAYYISINNYTAGCSDAEYAAQMGHDKAKELVNLYCKNK